MNATNNKFFGFYTYNSVGRLSVQVVDGANHDGYATEKTARTKLASKLEKYGVKVSNGIVCSFESEAAMLRYLKEANALVRG